MRVTAAFLQVGNFCFSHFPAFSPGAWQDGRSDDRWIAPAYRFLGPLRLQSPERMLGLRCSFSSDIWSFGILARFLVTGAFPLPIQDPPSVLGFKTSVVEAEVPALPIFPLDPPMKDKALRCGNADDFSPALRRQLALSQMAALESSSIPSSSEQTDNRPAQDGSENRHKASAAAAEPNACPPYFSRELSHLIGLCLDRSDHRRPAAKDLLQHRFFVRYPPSKEDLKTFLKQGRQARSLPPTQIQTGRAVETQPLHAASTPK